MVVKHMAFPARVPKFLHLEAPAGMPRGRRGFGSAVQALLRYLSAAGSALPAAEGGSEPPRSPLRPGPSPAPPVRACRPSPPLSPMQARTFQACYLI